MGGSAWAHGSSAGDERRTRPLAELPAVDELLLVPPPRGRGEAHPRPPIREAERVPQVDGQRERRRVHVVEEDLQRAGACRVTAERKNSTLGRPEASF